MQPSATFCGSLVLCAVRWRGEGGASLSLRAEVTALSLLTLKACPWSPSSLPAEPFESPATPVGASPKSLDEVFPGKQQGDPKTGGEGRDGKQNAVGGKERVGCSLQGFRQTPQKIRPQASPSWQKRLASHGRT